MRGIRVSDEVRERLREHMEERNLSIASVAQALGFKEKAMRDWLDGQPRDSVDKAVRKILNLPAAGPGRRR